RLSLSIGRHSLALLRILAPVPAGRLHFFFRNLADVELGLEPKQDGSPGELAAGDDRRVRPGPAVPLADHFGEQVNASAELLLVAKIVFPSAITAHPAPFSPLVGEPHAVSLIVADLAPLLQNGDPVLLPAR